MTTPEPAGAVARSAPLDRHPVLDSLTEIVFQTDPAGSWTYLNPAWTTVTGFAVEQTLGTNFLDYVHPEEREHTVALFMAVVAAGADHCHHQTRYRTADGSYRWVDLRATVLRDDAGTIIGNAGTIVDVTARRQAEETVAEHVHLLELVVGGASLAELPLGVALYGADLRLRRVSPVVERLLGLKMDAGEPAARVFDLLDANSAGGARFAGEWGLVATAARTGRAQYSDVQLVRAPDGRRMSLHASIIPLPAAGGEQMLALVVHDVTDLRRAERQQAAVAKLGKQGLAGESVPALLQEAVELVADTLDAGCCQVLELLHPADVLLARAAVGWPGGVRDIGLVPVGSAESVVGRTLAANAPVVCDLADVRSPESWLRAQNLASSLSVAINGRGAPFGVLAAQTRQSRSFTADEIDFVQAVANVLAAAIERAQAEEGSRQRALHDPLTGLANRVLLHDRLEQALRGIGRSPLNIALLLLDLDRFKEINDTLGHDVGDDVLRLVAARLTRATRSVDTVARLGGDEFALVLPSLGDVADAVRIARKVHEAISEQFELHGMPLHVEATTGIAIAPLHGSDSVSLLQRADVAMYRAKQDSTGVAVYSAETDENRPERLAYFAELGRGIKQGQLVLHYQPVISLATGAISAVEALVRWQHPTQGLLWPDRFLPLAEQTGLIKPLTRRVLALALAEAKRWHEAGHDVAVAVNISARMFGEADLVATIVELLAVNGLAPAALQLEITESAVMLSTAAARQLIARLRDAGVRTSVDDFGTGYSSLAYLRDLPVHDLKIDRSFVRNVTRHDRDAAIMQSIIDLGHHLGLRVVAEGIETAGALRLLREMGCDQGQGYFLGQPSPVVRWEAANTSG